MPIPLLAKTRSGKGKLQILVPSGALGSVEVLRRAVILEGATGPEIGHVLLDSPLAGLFEDAVVDLVAGLIDLGTGSGEKGEEDKKCETSKQGPAGDGGLCGDCGGGDYALVYRLGGAL